MDSLNELEEIYQRLALQVELGADEWTLDVPIDRFEEPESVATPQKANAPVTKLKPTPAKAAPASLDLPALMADAHDYDALIDILTNNLPRALAEAIANTDEAPLMPVGDVNAEFLVIVDAPSREAAAAGDLRADAANMLLEKSLNAIGLGIDGTQKLRAQYQLVSVSPWRMPQNRRITDGEAAFFAAVIKRFVELGQFRGVLFAGGDLAGLSPNNEGRFEGLPSLNLVSPRAMLREPLLKRRHWQMLLKLHEQLDEILKI